MKKQKKQREGSYDVYSYRFHEEVNKRFKDLCKKKGLSQNLTLQLLLDNY